MRFFAYLAALAVTVIVTWQYMEGTYLEGSSLHPFVGLGLIVLALVLLRQMKLAAYDLSKRTVSTVIEKRRAGKDKKEGLSGKEYARRLASATITPEKAREMLAVKPRDFDEAVSRLNEGDPSRPLVIPTFIYEQGLPGEHQLRAAGKQVNTVATIDGSAIVFSESSEGYKANERPGREIARIPASSVRRIIVYDFDGKRRVKKISAKALDTVLNTLGGGALHMKTMMPATKVIAACIVIEYLNEDGIQFQAIFKIMLGTGANAASKTAMERVLDFRNKLDKADKWEDFLAGSAFVEDSPFLALADSILSKVATARKVMALLSVDDPAIPLAKATAEMLALFTQNPGFQLGYVQESRLKQ